MKILATLAARYLASRRRKPDVKTVARQIRAELGLGDDPRLA